jgi:asparagine N-glycosylation enzyme membrane subunit Stt3
MTVSPLVWAATLAGIVLVFVVDFVVVGRKPHVVGIREASVSVLLYVALAVAFGFVIWFTAGRSSPRAMLGNGGPSRYQFAEWPVAGEVGSMITAGRCRAWAPAAARCREQRRGHGCAAPRAPCPSRRRVNR